MSGAYLFMPSGDAVDAHVTENEPTIYVIKGHILSQVVIQFSNVKHSIVLRHTKGNFSLYILDFFTTKVMKKKVNIFNLYEIGNHKFNTIYFKLNNSKK
jgi:hypothetical protein